MLEFGKNKAQKDGKQVQCIECRKLTNSEYYKKTPEKNIERRAWSIARRSEGRLYILSVLQQSACVDCGNDDWRVIEFDHLRDKLYNISDMTKRACSVETIKAEIAKCVTRCANCHRIKTHIEQGWYKDAIVRRLN